MATKMENQTPKSHKLNKTVRVLLLPLMAILWLIGWSLYWLGHGRQMAKSVKSSCHDDVTFTVLMPEQKHAE
jgi:hypothetical protein